MRRLLAALAASLVAAGAAAAQTTTFTNARWWTPDGFEAGDRHVRDGVFTAAPEGPADRTVDLGGAWVVPPFGEAHNHNLDLDHAGRLSAMGRTYLSAGILYVKNPNSRGEWDPGLETLVNQPDTVDAIFSRGGLTAPGGHPIRLYGFLSRFAGPPRAGETFEGDAFHLVTREADIAPVLDRLTADGADFIKLYLLGSEHYAERADDPAFYGLRGLDPALVPPLVRAAHDRGLRISVHVETAADFRTAVAAGVDEINHLPGYAWHNGSTAEDYRLTEADAGAAAAAGTIVVTTTVVSTGQNATPERLAAIQALQRENLRRLQAAGVRLAIGSDSYTATAQAEAVNLLAIEAFDEAELLRLWIDTPRLSIFPDRAIGRLDPGFEANFILLPGDPAEDFAHARAVQAVYKAGEVIWSR